MWVSPGVTWCQAGLASSKLTGPGLWRDIFFCFDSSAKISPARTLWPLNSGALLSAPHLIQALLTCHLAPGNVANINYHVECVNVCNLRTSSHHGTWKVFINLIFVCLFHHSKYLANFIANKLGGNWPYWVLWRMPEKGRDSSPGLTWKLPLAGAGGQTQIICAQRSMFCAALRPCLWTDLEPFWQLYLCASSWGPALWLLSAHDLFFIQFVN